MMKKFAMSLTATVATLAGLAAPVHAEISTGTLEVIATVDPYCRITSTPVNFGNYRPHGNTLFATGKLTLTCTKNTAPSLVRLDHGKNAAGGAVRKMIGAVVAGQQAETLTYELYKPTVDNACTESSTNVWGDDTDSGLSLANVIAAGESREISVCGKLAAGQFVTPGTYSDMVTASVEF